MWEYLPVAFKGVNTLEKTSKSLSSLIKGKKGAKRIFLDEIRHNLTVCWLYLKRDAKLKQVIDELRHDVYDQLSVKGFDYNSLKKGKIESHPSLTRSDLKYLVGKRTEDLIHKIYGRIKDLKLTYKLSANNPKNRYSVRIINIQKRMLLLLRHLK